MSNRQIVLRVPQQTFAMGSALTILFIALKLTGYISWGWLWIVSPIWIPFALALCGLIFALIGMGFITFLAWLFHK